MRCGVFRSVWVIWPVGSVKCLPPLLGWLFIELLAGRFPRLWCGSKEARAHRPESGVPTSVSSSTRKALYDP